MEQWLDRFARANFARSNDTAHDLKTPLNVAVLNLELMRMRVRKLMKEDDDEKLADYVTAIEGELRRMARIFDTFFILSTPPKDAGEPEAVDVAPFIREAASKHGLDVAAGTLRVHSHPARISQGIKMFFEGASKLLASGATAEVAQQDGALSVTLDGAVTQDDLETTRIFKFYYSDADGNPDLSLAAARLIAETYGGELNAEREGDRVTFRMTLPLGDE